MPGDEAPRFTDFMKVLVVLIVLIILSWVAYYVFKWR